MTTVPAAVSKDNNTIVGKDMTKDNMLSSSESLYMIEREERERTRERDMKRRRGIWREGGGKGEMRDVFSY
ncbi:hypothetical protein DPMN_113865 [Dreissena polymorpha]|uniref:Uncharacterized protein n=1 Tax=Dreissena polymorpha TaxID=45954 RepID=A0A9D4KJG3_DREPO|nr:hypothetical protein DPMN_113865 [Dreissena polymorpha]